LHQMRLAKTSDFACAQALKIAAIPHTMRRFFLLG
jgi:hypothetical protein